MKDKPSQFEIGDPASWPAVLAEEDAVKPLGMKVNWFEVLAKRGHLHCLAGYKAGCPRYYASKYILSLREDMPWLEEAFRIIRECNSDKNAGD